MAESQVIVPRNFVLLEELEKSEKGQYPYGASVGLSNMDDIYMHSWNGLILSNPQTCKWGEVTLSFEFYCDKDYPKKPPTVIKCISPLGNESISYKDATGKIIKVTDPEGNITHDLPILKNWNRNNRMIDIIIQLKKCIDSLKC
jgi:ubiquitin-conjugating enzyme E2 variant